MTTEDAIIALQYMAAGFPKKERGPVHISNTLWDELMEFINQDNPVVGVDPAAPDGDKTYFSIPVIVNSDLPAGSFMIVSQAPALFKYVTFEK